MLSFNQVLRAAMLASAIAGAATLAGCTLTPVYNDASASQQAMALNFAAPNSPLEQIVYQELARRFGTSDSPNAPSISVAVTTATRALTQSVTTDPAANRLLTATGTVKITKGGQPVLTATRQATATYSDSGQVMGDNSAETNAADQAAKALAETLQLTIMAALTPATAGQ